MWMVTSATSPNWEKESLDIICNCPGSSSRLSCGVSKLEVPNFAKSRFGVYTMKLPLVEIEI